jgi:DtxR family transcriptional regulator, Mn-dependent transcriptional regulator
MENLSQTEENYLKAIFKICEQEEKPASTNAIAGEMNTAAASVSDMLKRLAGKELIHYEKHRGVTLSESGNQIATMLVRKHRLWEVFLVKTLDFSWDEVHEMAEELEHVQSPELIDRLDKFLGHPRFDPHGDPIPDAHGNFASRKQVQLSDFQEHSSVFLQYLDKMSLGLGAEVCVKEIFEFDGSLKISIGNQQEIIISSKVSENLLVQKTK